MAKKHLTLMESVLSEKALPEDARTLIDHALPVVGNFEISVGGLHISPFRVYVTGRKKGDLYRKLTWSAVSEENSRWGTAKIVLEWRDTHWRAFYRTRPKSHKIWQEFYCGPRMFAFDKAMS